MFGPRSLPLALAMILGLSALAAVAGATWSAYSKTTGTVSNSFATASSFCPSTMPTTVFMTGFEIGKAGTAGGALFNGGTNGTSGTDGPDSTVKRNGSYSMRLQATGGQDFRSRAGALWTAKPAAVLRFALRLASLPTADVAELAKLPSTGTNSNLRLGYKQSTNKLTLSFGTSTAVTSATLVEASTTVTAGQWYAIEIKVDLSANPNTASWRIDNVAQTSTSTAQAANNVNGLYLGTNWAGTPADTFTANYDDVLLSQTAADYPIGDGKILPLLPNASGTHNNPSSVLQDETSVAIGATTWNKLDDVPLDGLTDYVKQTATNTSAYGEFGFQDPTDTCIRAVRGYMTYDPQNTTSANAGKTSVFDGTTESVIYNGAMQAASTPGRTEAAMVTGAASPWTQSAVNGLVARIGYSSDAAPTPRWTALMLEYDVPQ